MKKIDMKKINSEEEKSATEENGEYEKLEESGNINAKRKIWRREEWKAKAANGGGNQKKMKQMAMKTNSNEIMRKC